MRNRNIDFIRGLSILLIVIYHVYAIEVIYGYAPKIQIPILYEILMFGGEIGVTTFFIISGYGIYCSIAKNFKNYEKVNYFIFIKKRLIRIGPQYYLSLAFVLFITEGAMYLSRDGLKSILTHYLFIHNFWTDTHGALNGALWTMGVIVQFYLIAILLFKVVKKNGYIALILACIITIFTKYLFFHIIGVEQKFVYGRQLITAIDNFVWGMVIAKFHQKHAEQKSEFNKVEGFILSLSVVLFCVFLIKSKQWGVYSDSIIGYIWHSVLDCLLSIMIMLFSRIEINFKRNVWKPFMIISKNEYGIYVWHFLIVNVLLAKSSIFNHIASVSFLLLSLVITLITVLVGVISTKLIDESVFIEQLLRGASNN